MVGTSPAIVLPLLAAATDKSHHATATDKSPHATATDKSHHAAATDKSNRLVILLRGEAFRTYCAHTEVTQCKGFESAFNGTSLQETCLRSLRTMVVEYARSVGWNVRILAHVFVREDPPPKHLFTQLMAGAGLTTLEKFIRVEPPLRSQIETKLRAFQWAQQELAAAHRPNAYLLLRPDIEFKQLLRLPKPSAMGDSIVQPFQEGDHHDGSCKNASSGNRPLVSDVFTLVPASRAQEYEQFLAALSRNISSFRRVKDEWVAPPERAIRDVKPPGRPSPRTPRPADLIRPPDAEHSMCDHLSNVRFFVDRTCHNSNTIVQQNPLFRLVGRPEAVRRGGACERDMLECAKQACVLHVRYRTSTRGHE